jgi:hypothetical protein
MPIYVETSATKKTCTGTIPSQDDSLVVNCICTFGAAEQNLLLSRGVYKSTPADTMKKAGSSVSEGAGTPDTQPRGGGDEDTTSVDPSASQPAIQPAI